jgi:hypothetical protein
MEFLAQLWIPIIVSAVLVFIASSLIHMVFKWHNSEYRKLPNEDAVRTVMRSGGATPGQYVIPHCADMKELKSPEMTQKFVEGPIAFLTLRPPGPPKMGGALGLWFALNVGVSVIAAYIAFKTMTPESTFYQVCRVTSAIGFMSYGIGSVTQGIWMGKPWSAVAKELLDAIIYAVILGCVFAWLWPR